MVSQLKRKELFIPLIVGLLFSVLYYYLPIKYLAAGIVGVIGVALILYDIKLGLIAAVFILPFLPDMLILLFMFFLLVVFAYKQKFGEYSPLTKSPIDMPIVLFLIIIVISTITSIYFIGSFRDLALHIGGLCFVIVMMNSVKTKEDFNKVFIMLVISATLVAFYGLYQYVVGVDMEAAWVDTVNSPDVSIRIYSVFYNPNILAEYLIFIIPLSVSLLWYSKKLHKKILFLGTTGICTLALVLTLSRGGWLGFAFSALIFILLIERRLLLSIIPIVVGGVLFLPDVILNRILSIGNLQDSSIAYRITMYEITTEIIKEHWIAGVGFGHLPFKQTYETYIRTMPIYHSHNTYLQTAVELGIPGLIAFLLFLFVLFKYGIIKLIKNDDKYIRIMSAGVISALGGVLLHGMTDNVLYLPKIILTFWILVSFILTLVRINDQEKGIS